jgi:hypothetical protein
MPAWLKLTMLSVMFGSLALTLLGSFTLLELIARLADRPVDLQNPADWSGFFILASLFFTAVAPALLLGNLILWHVPPLRRAIDCVTDGVPGYSYDEAMASLKRTGKVMTPAGLLLGLIGIFAF